MLRVHIANAPSNLKLMIFEALTATLFVSTLFFFAVAVVAVAGLHYWNIRKAERFECFRTLRVTIGKCS